MKNKKRKYVIRNRRELKEFITIERNKYPSQRSCIHRMYACLCGERDYYVCKFLKLLRVTEYYDYKRSKNKLFTIMYVLYKHKKNMLGNHIGLDIGENICGKGLFIAHTSIIIGSATVGENLFLTGQNCIGSGAVIGDNCTLFNGAKIYSGGEIQDNTTVAGGGIVVSKFDKKNVLVGGVPAKILKE